MLLRWLQCWEWIRPGEDVDTDFVGLNVFSFMLSVRGSEEGKVSAWRRSLNAIGGTQLLLNWLLWGLGQVGSLNVFLYTDKWLLESVEWAGVQHLHLDFSGIWTPQEKEELLLFGRLCCALMLMHVLEVEQSIATFAGSALLQVFQELIVLCIAIADHLSIDLLFFANVEDHIAMFLVFFDFLEDNFAVIVNWKFFFVVVGLGREEKKCKNAIRKIAWKLSEIDGRPMRVE